jgi:dual specificity MAP kinase phosphatase
MPDEALPKPIVDLPTTNVADDRAIPFRRRVRNLFRQLQTQGPWITFIEAVDQSYRMLRGAPTRRMSEITPRLVVGGQHSAKGLAILRRRGVTAIVNLRHESDDREKGRALDHYLYLPTIDNTPPTLEHLQQAATFIADEIRRGGKVYVHCWEGVGRAPTTACAYLVSTGMTPDEAWRQIRRVRPFIRPTPFQIAQIDRFAEQKGLG